MLYAALKGGLLYGLGGINGEFFRLKAKTLLAAITGTVITIVPSLLVLPNTADRRVRGLGGHILESLGNSTFSLLENFLQVRTKPPRCVAIQRFDEIQYRI